MLAGPVESLLLSWGVWSRHDLDVGPPIDRKAASAEGFYRSPQCWNERRPREVVIPDDEALRIERAVLATGPILCASLRSYYIHGRAPRRRAEVDVLRIAIRRVGDVLDAAQDRAESPVARPTPAGEVDIADAARERL